MYFSNFSMSISLILAFHYYNKIKIDKIDQTQKSMSKGGEKKEKKGTK